MRPSCPCVNAFRLINLIGCCNNSTPPVITPPDNITLPCNTDLSDYDTTGRAELEVTCGQSGPIQVNTRRVGSCPAEVNRTFSFTDRCNRTVSAVQMITLSDGTNGTTANLTIVAPANISVPCNGSLDPTFTGVPNVTGGCPGSNLSFVDSNSSAICPGRYTITRVWTVTDSYVVMFRCIYD